MLMLMTGWLAVRRGYPRAARWPTAGELWRDLKPALPALLAPVILIAGMLAGYFTPTEIASVTVLYTRADQRPVLSRADLEGLLAPPSRPSTPPPESC